MRSLNLATTMPTFRPAPSRDPTCSTTAPAARLVALALPPTERRSPSPTVLASRPRGGPAAPRLLPAGLAKMAALGPATPEAFKHPALVALAVTMSPQQCPSLSCLCLLGCFGGGAPSWEFRDPTDSFEEKQKYHPLDHIEAKRQTEREGGGRSATKTGRGEGARPGGGWVRGERESISNIDRAGRRVWGPSKGEGWAQRFQCGGTGHWSRSYGRVSPPAASPAMVVAGTPTP